MKKRPQILTIAGFDPSGGAGILADLKTFESNRCLGMAVQTANTIQTENLFKRVQWEKEDFVLEQLNCLLSQYKFDSVKIGLVPSVKFLKLVVELIRQSSKEAIIVWDPVLSASAGFDFGQDLTELKEVLPSINWVTPNWMEVKKLSNNSDAKEGAHELSELTKIYLKGGHAETDLGKDYLIENRIEKGFNPKLGNCSEKHGSGCVFSSALASNLASGYPEQKAVLRAKRYVEYYLGSHKGLLGNHKN